MSDECSNQPNESRPKLGFEIRGGAEKPGGLTDACKRHTERLRVGVQPKFLLTGWMEANLNPDQGYDVKHTRKWSFVIDISDINPC